MQDMNENVQSAGTDEEQNQMEGNQPSPPMEIEGIVRGEPDTGIVQSGGNMAVNDDVDAASAAATKQESPAEVHMK